MYLTELFITYSETSANLLLPSNSLKYRYNCETKKSLDPETRFITNIPPFACVINKSVLPCRERGRERWMEGEREGEK